LSEHQCVCKRDKFLRDRVFDNNEVYNHLFKFIKNRLYLHYRVYCVMEKLLLREVTASFM